MGVESARILVLLLSCVVVVALTVTVAARKAGALKVALIALLFATGVLAAMIAVALVEVP